MVSTQTPPPQSRVPVGQVAAQPPCTQYGMVTGHAAPQPPQFAGSLEVSTHSAPHSVPVHAPGTHWLALHASARPQVWPQRPQSSCADVVSTQPPLQSVRPVEHCATHAPLSHSGVPAPHALPHAPQFSGSAELSMQTPLQKLGPFGHWLPAGLLLPPQAATSAAKPIPINE